MFIVEEIQRTPQNLFLQPRGVLHVVPISFLVQLQPREDLCSFPDQAKPANTSQQNYFRFISQLQNARHTTALISNLNYLCINAPFQEKVKEV